MVKEVEGCPAKTAISPKIAEIGEIAEISKDKCWGRYKGAKQKLRFLQNLRKIGEIAVFAKINQLRQVLEE